MGGLTITNNNPLDDPKNHQSIFAAYIFFTLGLASPSLVLMHAASSAVLT